MTKHPLTEIYFKAIKQALKKFGEYSFYDKGASEVMIVDAKPFLALPQKERVQVAKELMKTKAGRNFCIELSGYVYDGDLPDAECEELMAILEPED